MDRSALVFVDSFESHWLISPRLEYYRWQIPLAWGALAILFLFARVLPRIYDPRELKTAFDHAAAEFASLIRVPEKDGVLDDQGTVCKESVGTEDGDICRHYLSHQATFESFVISSSAIA